MIEIKEKSVSETQRSTLKKISRILKWWDSYVAIYFIITASIVKTRNVYYFKTLQREEFKNTDLDLEPK